MHDSSYSLPILAGTFTKNVLLVIKSIEYWNEGQVSGADPGFFLGGGILVSCSTSTPINHIVFLFFFAEYQLY